MTEAEAAGIRHNHIGTEHLLLGLLSSDDGAAAKTLTRLGVNATEVRSEIEQIIGLGTAPPAGQPPFTPRVKKVLDLANREARRLGHNYVAPNTYCSAWSARAKGSSGVAPARGDAWPASGATLDGRAGRDNSWHALADPVVCAAG